MLCNVNFENGMGLDGVIPLFQGVYQTNTLNFQNRFRNQNYKLDYPNLGPDFNCYGVCDGIEQLVEKLPDVVLKDDTRKFAISIVRLDKINEPPSGGWRWHKWGPYIGTQDPQCEYLADEPRIRTVWVYHIYELDDSEIQIESNEFRLPRDLMTNRFLNSIVALMRGATKEELEEVKYLLNIYNVEIPVCTSPANSSLDGCSELLPPATLSGEEGTGLKSPLLTSTSTGSSESTSTT